MLLGAGAPAIVRNYPTVAEHGAGTPLHTMNGLAQSLGLRTIYAKDESQRLGLGSFKALGGAYAVARVVELWAERALGHKVAPARLTSAEARAAIAGQTVACATDGNHGLSVAAGAKLFGCRAVIFVHARVPRARLDAIERLGATIVVVKGSYDDSVDECSRTAAQEGWQVVSDTSWPGYEIIPGQTMQGYTVMIDECLRALEATGERLTHFFVQGGCGGLAAAAAAHMKFKWKSSSPKVVVVEPDRASCILQSALAGQRTLIDAAAPTLMGMLECYQPSLIAWRILERTAYAFMDISDDASVAAKERLASPLRPDPVILSTESGSAGLGGLQVAARNSELRAALGLTEESSVLLLVSEGAKS